MLVVRIWNFDKSVTVQYNNSIADDIGGQTSNWVTLETVNVMVMPVSASKQMEGAKYGIFYTHRFMCMYDDFWTAYYATAYRKRLRLIYDGKTYAVNGIENPGDFGKWIVLNCQELP